MFLVKCPRCGKNMNCAPRKPVKDAIKNCVYCGKSFKIHPSLSKTRIVKTL